MLAHALVTRPTADVDLFGPDKDDRPCTRGGGWPTRRGVPPSRPRPDSRG